MPSAAGDKSSGTFILSGTPPDRDFVLRIGTIEHTRPTLVIQKSPLWDHTVCMLTFVPEFDSLPTTSPGEFVFLLDCSGSMSGPKMQMAKSAVLIFVKSLPLGCLFNVYFFGSEFSAVFSSGSHQYNDTTANEVVRRIRAQDASLGGTNVHDPLASVLKNPPPRHHTRNVFIVTDGDIENASTTLGLVRDNKMSSSVHTIGIGNGIRHALLTSIAHAGNGRCEFVAATGDRLEPKVVHMLELALRPALAEVNVSWPKECEVIRQTLPAAIYKGEPLVVLAMMKGTIKGLRATVEGVDTATGRKVRVETPEDLGAGEKELEEGKSLYQIAAREIMNDYKLEPNEEAKLSLQYQVLSRHTAYFVEDKLAISGPAAAPPVLIHIPVSLSADWVIPPSISNWKNPSGIAVAATAFRRESLQFHGKPGEKARGGLAFLNKKSWHCARFEPGEQETPAITTLLRERSRDSMYMHMKRARVEAATEMGAKTELKKELVEMQRADGSWHSDERLTKLLSIEEGKVPEKLRRRLLAKVRGDETLNDVWATLVAVHMLSEAMKKGRTEYVLVIRKAEGWLGKLGVSAEEFEAD